MLVDRNDFVNHYVLIPDSVGLMGAEPQTCHHRLAYGKIAQSKVPKQSTLVLVRVVTAQFAESDVTLGQLAVLTLSRLHIHRFRLCNHFANYILHY